MAKSARIFQPLRFLFAPRLVWVRCSRSFPAPRRTPSPPASAALGAAHPAQLVLTQPLPWPFTAISAAIAMHFVLALAAIAGLTATSTAATASANVASKRWHRAMSHPNTAATASASTSKPSNTSEPSPSKLYLCKMFPACDVQTLFTRNVSFHLWLDVDNVLADARPRMAAHSRNNKLLPSFSSPTAVLSDPVIEGAVTVINAFRRLGCKVHVLTARGGWARAHPTTKQWLRSSGISVDSLRVVASASEKVPLLSKVHKAGSHCPCLPLRSLLTPPPPLPLQACKRVSPCILVDDLRVDWHMSPIGERTTLSSDLISA